MSRPKLPNCQPGKIEAAVFFVLLILQATHCSSFFSGHVLSSTRTVPHDFETSQFGRCGRRNNVAGVGCGLVLAFAAFKPMHPINGQQPGISKGLLGTQCPSGKRSLLQQGISAGKVALRQAEQDSADTADDFMLISKLEQDILHGMADADIDSAAVVSSLRADEDEIEAAMMALEEEEGRVLLTIPDVLDAALCASLRAFADKHTADARAQSVDAMDGEAEWRVEVSKEELQDLIGRDAVQRLWELPQRLEERRVGGIPTLPPVWVGNAAVRVYSAEKEGGRRALGLHVDSDDCTVNVALSAPGSHCGGELLACVGGALRRIAPRAEGEGWQATVHTGDVAHGVRGVTRGSRYALLIFFNRPGFLFQRNGGRFRRPASSPS